MTLKWAIPDIHGEYMKMCGLLDAIDAQPDEIIFLGDYVDRGPMSYMVLKKLRELQKEGTIALLGNHERLMTNAVLRATYSHCRLWDINGGHRTADSFKKMTGSKYMREMGEYSLWLNSLPTWHDDGQYFYSHAPMDPVASYPGILDKEHPDHEQVLTWTYLIPEKDAMAIPDRTGVCGHIHRLQHGVIEPRMYDHYLYLDAGCGCAPDAPLIAYNLQDRYYVNHKGEKYDHPRT